MWGILLLISVFILAFLIYASYNISSNVYVKTFCKKKTDKKEVALTFDDGPNAVYTPKILDILKERNIKAAFFCIGSNVEKNAELVKRMRKEGNLIGNHSYSHVPNFPLLSVNKLIEDIKKGEEAIKSITNEPVRFFRPPFGVTNPLIKRALKSFDYDIIGWNIRSFDTSTKDTKKVVKRITRQLKPGSIILLHDVLPHADLILIDLLDYLQENGYEVAPLNPSSRQGC